MARSDRYRRTQAACTLALAIALGLLLPALDAGSQPVEQTLRTPPAWPTPEEYLGNRDRAEESAAPAASAASAAVVEAVVEDAPQVADLPPFTVQIAAFRRYPSALAFAGEVPVESIAILGSERNGLDWYVVVLGLYATQTEAAAVEADYRERYPTATTWLRGTAKLRRVEDPGEGQPN